jgi:hypothetical protein
MKGLMALLLLLTTAAWASDSITRVYWTETPIKWVIPVGEPVNIFLPDGDWGPGIPKDIAGVVDHYAYKNTLQLKATMAFQEKLVPVRNIDTQEQVLLMIQAKDSAPASDLQISFPPAKVEPLKGKLIDLNKTLTRFAARSLYAPARLVPRSSKINQVPVELREFKAFNRLDAVACVQTGELLAKPIASWQSGMRYVTALRLENISEHEITLDLRGCHVRGAFLTAALQHTTLLPKYEQPCSEAQMQQVGVCKRTYKEVTTLYLTSELPFWTALESGVIDDGQ